MRKNNLFNWFRRIICRIYKHIPSWEGTVWLGDQGLYQYTDCLYCKKHFIIKLTQNHSVNGSITDEVP
jgi:hypothetical protein